MNDPFPVSRSAYHAPAVATAATASLGAGAAGQRNVCTGILVSFSTAATAQTIIFFTLRDGATGAGTIKLQIPIILAANSQFSKFFSIPNLAGTSATAMTLELTDASGTVANNVTNSFSACAIFGALA
jgi:hypothetical protein